MFRSCSWPSSASGWINPINQSFRTAACCQYAVIVAGREVMAEGPSPPGIPQRCRNERGQPHPRASAPRRSRRRAAFVRRSQLGRLPPSAARSISRPARAVAPRPIPAGALYQSTPSAPRRHCPSNYLPRRTSGSRNPIRSSPHESVVPVTIARRRQYLPLPSGPTRGDGGAQILPLPCRDDDAPSPRRSIVAAVAVVGSDASSGDGECVPPVAIRRGGARGGSV